MIWLFWKKRKKKGKKRERKRKRKRKGIEGIKKENEKR
jgi:hypothetical protein